MALFFFFFSISRTPFFAPSLASCYVLIIGIGPGKGTCGWKQMGKGVDGEELPSIVAASSGRSSLALGTSGRWAQGGGLYRTWGEQTEGGILCHRGSEVCMHS